MAEPVRLERDGALGQLVLDSPPLNLFTEEVLSGLERALEQTDGLRALVLRAEGRYFTGGVDVNVFNGLGRAGSEELTERLLALAHAVEELPFPTIASVHSLCLTAGLELSLACDMIWAAESARFGLVEAVIGLTPLMGGTQRIAERAGAGRAREFVMSGDLYDAGTLERWGVVNRVLPDAELASGRSSSRAASPTGRRSLTPQRRPSCARTSRKACAGPTRERAGSVHRCSRPRTFRGRWRASWQRARAGRVFRGADRLPPLRAGSVPACKGRVNRRS